MNISSAYCQLTYLLFLCRIEIKKTMSEEETTKVREENEKIRIERDAEADKIASVSDAIEYISAHPMAK